MILSTDQLGRTVLLPTLPGRIVSLVPSQTELLAYLGLDAEVVGITKFCVHPQHWFRSKQRIGGTKNVHQQRVEGLAPQLVLANKEENVRDQVESLATHFPTWISDVNNLAEALDMIRSVGHITGRASKAAQLAKEIEQSFQSLTQLHPAPRTAYLIWKDPYMTVGGDSFINDMLRHAGFRNVFADQQRYPSLSAEALQAMNPEVVLLSSEPYPFSQKHIAELQQLLPRATILLVDGEMFSWYGSRMLHAPAYFAQVQEQWKQARRC